MSAQADSLPERAPVQDSIERIDREVAIGEDLDFQRSWWKFERYIWVFFAVLIVLDLGGVFGRGPLAQAGLRAPDGSIDVRYERVERTGTPSMMSVTLDEKAVADGTAHVFVSDSVISGLGAQRIVPQPLATVVGRDGLTYTFPVDAVPAIIRFELQPSSAGRYAFRLEAPGSTPVRGHVIVMP